MGLGFFGCKTSWGYIFRSYSLVRLWVSHGGKAQKECVGVTFDVNVIKGLTKRGVGLKLITVSERVSLCLGR